MMEHALICPQCKAPLTAHRFVKSVVCSFCGTTVLLEESSVSVEQFHQAFAVWNSPESYSLTSWFPLGGRNWVLERMIARGETCDVYTGRLARWPTELVIIKILRDGENDHFINKEWETLRKLVSSRAAGVDFYLRMIPQPVLFDTVAGGAFTGRKVLIERWESGFHHTFAEVCLQYPQGIPARASIWVWRRILEMLSSLHESGFVHGAVVPEHLLVQENDHGVRLVGYGRSGRQGEPINASESLRPYFPTPEHRWKTLSPQLDIVMSAKCIMKLLGGDVERLILPSSVPSVLGKTILNYAQLDSRNQSNIKALSIHQELGSIADQIYGPPMFIPIEMPR